MTRLAPPLAEPAPPQLVSPARGARSGLLRLVGSVLAGLALYLAFPPVGRGLLQASFLALLGAARAVRTAGHRRRSR